MNTLDYILEKFKPELAKKGQTKIQSINRTIMAETLAELGFNKGAEVGVAEGMHAEVLCKANPNLTLHCVDIWEQYEGYREYGWIDKSYKEAMDRLAKHNTVIHKLFSADAVKEFEDNSLDFVYIDAGHDFKNVAIDICSWTRKVRIGGIVFGHDFKRWKPGKSRYVVDVKDVVGGYMYAKNIMPWFELTNDIKDPTFGRDNPGWMFVRQKSDFIGGKYPA